jgi:hypothetical protein
MQMKRVDSTNKTREREGGVKFKVSNQSKAVFPLFTFDEKNLHLMDGYACVNEHKEGAVHNKHTAKFKFENVPFQREFLLIVQSPMSALHSKIMIHNLFIKLIIGLLLLL